MRRSFYLACSPVAVAAFFFHKTHGPSHSQAAAGMSCRPVSVAGAPSISTDRAPTVSAHPRILSVHLRESTRVRSAHNCKSALPPHVPLIRFPYGVGGGVLGPTKLGQSDRERHSSDPLPPNSLTAQRQRHLFRSSLKQNDPPALHVGRVLSARDQRPEPHQHARHHHGPRQRQRQLLRIRRGGVIPLGRSSLPFLHLLQRPIVGILEVRVHIALRLRPRALFLRLIFEDRLKVRVLVGQTLEERHRTEAKEGADGAVRFFLARRGPSSGGGVVFGGRPFGRRHGAEGGDGESSRSACRGGRRRRDERIDGGGGDTGAEKGRGEEEDGSRHW
mmetsp:Transcript_44513/g.135674  ORF Transcript_44513/g.135674 Transcript_44513/m.135674 type:complete len:332 (+) Transcript_44513:165-1160(+)